MVVADPAVFLTNLLPLHPAATAPASKCGFHCVVLCGADCEGGAFEGHERLDLEVHLTLDDGNVRILHIIAGEFASVFA